MDVGNYDKLTPNQQESTRRDLLRRKNLAIAELNRVVKILAHLGVETRLTICEQDDSETHWKFSKYPKTRNVNPEADGPKYPVVLEIADPNTEACGSLHSQEE